MEDDDGNHAKKGKQEDYSADSSSSSSSNNNDILLVCNSDLTPDEKVRIIRDITESLILVASNNNNNKAPEETSIVLTLPLTSTPSTTSAATAVVTKETHDDTQSGSDLAPFFGASVRDRIIDGMKDIINVYKSRENINDTLKIERLVVQITGKNGTPIHYEESFENAVSCGNDIDGLDGISLFFDNSSGDDLTTDGFPLSSLNNEIEIRFGGVVIQRFNVDDLIICFHDFFKGYDEENRMEYITLQHNINRRHLYGPISLMQGIIGPLPLGWRQEYAAGVNMVLTDFLELVADENNDLTPQTLIIIELHFREKDITPGIMSLIE